MKPTTLQDMYTSNKNCQSICGTSAVVTDEQSKGIGLGFRKRTPTVGPELEFVREFLNNQTWFVPKKSGLSIFIEPEICGSYPDIVAVVWKKKAMQNWAVERSQLEPLDIKLLHVLSGMGWTSYEFLKKLFPKTLSANLDRIEAAQLLIRRTNKCKLRSTHQFFAIEHIFSIEAKMTGSQRLINQAHANTWFSSESHALIPKTQSSDVLNQARQRGIGVMSHSNATTQTLSKPKARSAQTSYISWLLNEWIWRIQHSHNE
jgi:hypothetical protein